MNIDISNITPFAPKDRNIFKNLYQIVFFNREISGTKENNIVANDVNDVQ